MKVSYLLGSLNRGGTETLTLDVFRKAATNGLELIGIYRKKGGNIVKIVTNRNVYYIKKQIN